jgi:hypothetical protein
LECLDNALAVREDNHEMTEEILGYYHNLKKGLSPLLMLCFTSLGAYITVCALYNMFWFALCILVVLAYICITLEDAYDVMLEMNMMIRYV